MTNTNYYIYSVFELLYLDNNTIMSNVCEPAVYLYTNARGRVIYVSVIISCHSLYDVCGKSKLYIGELIYNFIQKLVGRAIYLRSEA